VKWRRDFETVNNLIEREHLEHIIAQQLAMIGDPAREAALRSILVEPRVKVREWDYGAEYEEYPYWVVAEALERGILLAYCEQGFGPEHPWGFLLTDEPEFATLGMDSQWNGSLERAFVSSGLWPGTDGAKLHWPPEQRFP
jgi:hypothetical protein